jgi:hypothetical protein
MGTLFGLGIRSRGIFGLAVGEGELDGDGEGDTDGDGDRDALGCAVWACRVPPREQKTTTKKILAMFRDTNAALREEKGNPEGATTVWTTRDCLG